MEYDNTYPTIVKSSTTTDAEGNKFVTMMKYPFDFANASKTSSNTNSKAVAYMNERHMLNTPLETLTYNQSNGNILGGELNLFRMHDNSVVLDQKMSLRHQSPRIGTELTPLHISGSSSTYSSLYKTDAKYYEYTYNLQPSIYKTGDGPIQEIKYGGNNNIYPVATFNNAYTEQDLANGNRIVYVDKISLGQSVVIPWQGTEIQVSYLQLDNSGKWVKHQRTIDIASFSPNLPFVTIDTTVKDLVIAPKYTTYSTQTIIPGIGKSSETDMNGVSVYYEYDEWGRLSKVLDNDKNVLKETEYGF
jgi:YD repeat-containing protein